jgi:sugar phosphate permease
MPRQLKHIQDLSPNDLYSSCLVSFSLLTCLGVCVFVPMMVIGMAMQTMPHIEQITDTNRPPGVVQ